MNYFAHGFRWLDDPERLAGTALPDFLRHLPGRPRIRPWHLEESNDDSMMLVGVRQHLEDDARFHAGDAFVRLNGEVRDALRALPHAERVRASVAGHILIEMLLDRSLIARRTARLTRYYHQLDHISSTALQATAEALLERPLDGLAGVFDRFRRTRFLESYRTDEGLVERFERVLERARLTPPPPAWRNLVPDFQRRVDDAAEALVPFPLD